jgi:NitT/TauT family transport system permease protein
MTTAVPALGRGRRRDPRVALLQYGPTVLVFVAVIALWEVGVSALDMRVRILPAPSAIVAALGENWSGGRWPLLESTLSTLFEAVGGLVIGTIVGVAVAFVVARWASAREAVLPVAVAVNAIPIIAAAPLMNNWFGVTSPVSKMMIAALLVFFPVMINVTRGLSQVEPASLELMRSYAASEREVMRKVRIPNALPYFFTALKVATTLSLIGAIVGEYFGGSSTVIGRVVVQSASALRFDVTWAAILLAATTGIVFYLIVAWVERAVIPWHASVRADDHG